MKINSHKKLDKFASCHQEKAKMKIQPKWKLLRCGQRNKTECGKHQIQFNQSCFGHCTNEKIEGKLNCMQISCQKDTSRDIRHIFFLCCNYSLQQTLIILFYSIHSLLLHSLHYINSWFFYTCPVCIGTNSIFDEKIRLDCALCAAIRALAVK